MRWWWSVIGLTACDVEPSMFRGVGRQPDVTEILSSPPTSPPEGERLYQLLYADEHGTTARQAGQRARMIGWVRSLSLSARQLEDLHGLIIHFRERMKFYQAELAAVDALEAELYGPIYADVIARLAGPDPWDQTALDALAGRLAEAQAKVAEEAPHTLARDRVQQQVHAIEDWANTLTDPQKERLSHSRYFLRRRLGPLGNPGHYESLIGTLWDVGDFDSLRYAQRLEDEHAMDIGGLWSSEPLRTGPDWYLSPIQLKTIVFLALTEPGICEAVEVLRGLREPDQYGPLSEVPPG